MSAFKAVSHFATSSLTTPQETTHTLTEKLTRENKLHTRTYEYIESHDLDTHETPVSLIMTLDAALK